MKQIARSEINDCIRVLLSHGWEIQADNTRISREEMLSSSREWDRGYTRKVDSDWSGDYEGFVLVATKGTIQLPKWSGSRPRRRLAIIATGIPVPNRFYGESEAIIRQWQVENKAFNSFYVEDRIDLGPHFEFINHGAMKTDSLRAALHMMRQIAAISV